MIRVTSAGALNNYTKDGTLLQQLFLFACLAVLLLQGVGCSPCGKRRQDALKPVLAGLDNVTASNLVCEARLCIANSLTQESASAYHRLTEEEAPVASSLGRTIGSPNDVRIARQGLNSPYIIIEVPVNPGGFCWWRVYVFVKPGGKYAESGEGYLGEALSKRNSLVKFSDEILIFPEQRTEGAK